MITRLYSTLLLLERNAEGIPVKANLSLAAAAQQFNESIDGLMIGDTPVPPYSFLRKLYIIPKPSEGKGYVAEHISNAILGLAGFKRIMALHGSFGRSIVPRIAAEWNAACLSDVIDIKVENGDTIVNRPIYAVEKEKPLAMTIRPSAFEPLQFKEGRPGSIEKCALAQTNGSAEYISSQVQKNDRPELGAAKVVISGGRALKTKEQFEKLMYGLADAFGPGIAAVGASRAAVDAGLAPNDLQVGQTGKNVAPDLYIAIGISGAIQHIAGMKDSKVIVAINKDADSPIFQLAEYSLSGDLFQIVPELTEKIKVITEAK